MVRMDNQESTDVSGRRPRTVRRLRHFGLNQIISREPGTYVIVAGNAKGQAKRISVRASRPVTDFEQLAGMPLKRETIEKQAWY